MTCSAVAFGQTPKPPRFEELVKQFEYDAKAPLDVRWRAAHELNAEARRDRVEWLAARLSLRRVDFDALARIPQLK